MENKPVLETQDIEKIVHLTTDFLANVNNVGKEGYLVFKQDGTMQHFEAKSVGLHELQEAVGGYITTAEIRGVANKPNLIFVVDEEGNLKTSELNVLISEMFGVRFVGNVVIIAKSFLK